MSTAEQPAPVVARQEGGGPRRLNQPWRGFVAAGEVVVAVAAVLLAVASWRHGVEHLSTPLADGRPPLRSTIYSGNWMSIGVGLVTVGAFLVLDALRQTALAIRTRRRPAPEPTTFTDPEPEPEAAPTGPVG